MIETPEPNHAKLGHKHAQNVPLKVTTRPIAVNAHQVANGGIETNHHDS